LAGRDWYCSVHLKKVQAEAVAEVAFKKEEKKAQAQAKAKAHNEDPNYHLCVAVAHGTQVRCQSRGTKQVADTEDWMCTTHYMGALARAKAHALDPNYHLCAAIAHGTLARCQNRATNQVAGTEDWMCTAHFKDALTKADRPKASQSEGELMNQQCCGNKKDDCQHQVKYIVDEHFFCHLHNPNKVVKKCMGTTKCKASGKFVVNGLNYCVAHNPEGPRCGATTAGGSCCTLAGVMRAPFDGDGRSDHLWCAGHARPG